MSYRATRRTLIAGTPALAALALAACSQEPTGPVLTADADLPTAVPSGTKLVVGDPQNQVAYEKSGLVKQLGFEIEWANISGGPKTQEAFRAHSLDIGSVADIPPIHAYWTEPADQDRRRLRPPRPPGAPDLRPRDRPGRRHHRPGRACAARRSRTAPGRRRARWSCASSTRPGSTQDDVELVELPSTGDTYSTALAGGEVDVGADRRHPGQVVPQQVRL